MMMTVVLLLLLLLLLVTCDTKKQQKHEQKQNFLFNQSFYDSSIGDNERDMERQPQQPQLLNKNETTTTIAPTSIRYWEQ